MYPFNFERVGGIAEAEKLLSGDDECILIAGGMTLLPAMKQRLAQPAFLLDLSSVESLAGITVSDSAVTIRAMTTHADVAGDADIKENLPALAALAAGIGDPQVRNRGTLGGSLANADPAADYPAALLALDATVVTNHRSIPAEQFFIDMFETTLEGNEIITSASFKIVTGAAGSVFTLSSVEDALRDEASVESLEKALAASPVDEDELNDDIHASAAYRAHLIPVMVRRAFEQLN